MHKELVVFTEDLVKSLVKYPDMVKVQEFGSDEEFIIIEIIVHSDDMGAIIGKSGKMANALRTIVQAFAYVNKINKVKINIDSF